MTIEEFIEKHRETLVQIIEPGNKMCVLDIDQEEIEMWILNDEGLYNWAMSEGVEI